MVPISPQKLNRVRPLVWPATLRTIFLQLFVNVQPIGLQPAPSSFRRPGASNEYSPVLISSAVWAPETKMLGHTNKHHSDFFFLATHQKSPSKDFNANALKPFTLWFWTRDRHCISHCLVSKSSIYFQRHFSGFELATPTELGKKPCHGLPMVCPKRMVPFPPKSDQPFGGYGRIY